jgi:hypothetical protein
MKHVSFLFDFQLMCLIVLNKSGLNLTVKLVAFDMEQHTLWKARTHLELGVVLGICPPATRCSLRRLIRLLSTWYCVATFFLASGAALSQEVPTVK